MMSAPDQKKSITSFRCSRCGLTMFPRHTRCRGCRGTDFDEQPVSEGEVVTYTRLTATRPGFAKGLRLAVVELSNGVRVLGQVDGGEEEGGGGGKGEEEQRQVRSGLRVKVSWGKLSEKDGRVITGFRFIPLE
jgi:uncharacterized OB-fold protein